MANPKDERAERLAQALRDNLRRRKAQAREEASVPPGDEQGGAKREEALLPPEQEEGPGGQHFA